MPTIEKIITNVDEEIEVTIYFDYQPEEPREPYYPGCHEEVTIIDVESNDGREMSFLGDFIELLEEEILEQIHHDENLNREWM